MANNKPFIFSMNLNKDLDHAFNDLHNLQADLAEIIDHIKELNLSTDNSENSNKLFEYIDALLDISNNLDKWSKTYESVVNTNLKNNSLVYERDTYQTLVRILQWDHVDVRQLARWIRELKEFTNHIGLDLPYLLHVKQIPTELVPDELKRYPVFIIDRQGYCLCGLELDEILHIDEVRDKLSQ
ncbi:MAG TPA: hypothetical protein O0X14_00435 [Methanocorpusculum sp.]|nr:hypothetical protein [Methanocorpusculum sp.]